MSLPLVHIAKAVAAKHSLDPTLVCAVCEHESSWEPNAVRLEQGFYQHYIKPLKLRPSESILRSCSFGLMQILGEVARELGFDGDFDALSDPETGIEYGCRKLAKCVASHPNDTVGALLAYNGGADQHYPDMVLPLMEKYRT